jgi:putative ABC transport system permease protein
MNAIVARFPNLTIVDVGAILDQVRRTGDQVGMAVRFVFAFTLAAGLLVLFAAIGATRDERLQEVAVMRVLGARSRQLAAAQWAEFSLLGALTALVAAVAAETLAAQFASRVLEIEPAAHWGLAFAGAGLGALAIAVAGVLATRGVLRSAPAATLRTIAG